MNDLPQVLVSLRTQIDRLCEVLTTDPGGFAPLLSAAWGKSRTQPESWGDQCARVVRHSEARIGAAQSGVQRELSLLRLQRLDLAVQLQEVLGSLLEQSSNRRRIMLESAMILRWKLISPERRPFVEQRIASVPDNAIAAKATLAPVFAQLRLGLKRIARAHGEVAAAFELPRAPAAAAKVPSVGKKAAARRSAHQAHSRKKLSVVRKKPARGGKLAKAKRTKPARVKR